MQANAEHVLALISSVEAGYQNNSSDNGNWTGGEVGEGRLLGTNHGITPRTLAAWRKVDVETLTEADMRALPESEAQAIITRQYLAKVSFDDLPSGLDLAVADCSVNSGPAQAGRLLQGVLGVDQDGIIGLHTLAALAGKPVPDLIHAYTAARMSFLRGLASWAQFGKGWSSRVAHIDAEATSMAAGKDRPPAPVLAPGAAAKAPPAPASASPWPALLSAVLALFHRS